MNRYIPLKFRCKNCPATAGPEPESIIYSRNQSFQTCDRCRLGWLRRSISTASTTTPTVTKSGFPGPSMLALDGHGEDSYRGRTFNSCQSVVRALVKRSEEHTSELQS